MGESQFMNDGTYPHLGYFLCTPWLSHVFSQLSNTTILKDPPLDSYNALFPFKISFFEDVQQQEFWDTAVRQYGFKSFHSRSLLLGARVKFTYKYCYPTRIKLQPAAFPFNLPKPSKSELQGMNLQQRTSSDYVRRLLKIAQSEEQYFDTSAHIRTEVDNVIAQAGKRDGDTTIPWQHVHFLRQAINLHLKVIKALLLSEATDGTVYTDRRENFLGWNSGARIFIRALNRLSDVDENANQLLLDLEYSRMSLSSPNSGVSEITELNALKQATALQSAGEFAESYRACVDIALEPGCSVFAEAAARIVAASLRPIRPDIPGQFSDLHIGFERMTQLRGVARGHDRECPEAWKVVLDLWIAEALKVLNTDYWAAVQVAA